MNATMHLNNDITNFVMSDIPIKKLNENAKIPTWGSDFAAGCDLYANITEPVMIKAHTTEKIGTGIALELPPYTWAGIFARSGLATKNGLRPANCVGVVDSDYRGEIIVALHNDTDKNQIISPNERIAQLIVFIKFHWNFMEVDELKETERGAGGFGSTGKI